MCIHEARDGQWSRLDKPWDATSKHTSTLSPFHLLSEIDLFLKFYISWTFQRLHEATGADCNGKLSPGPVETGRRQGSLSAAVTQKVSLSQDYGSLNQHEEENVSEEKGYGCNIYWLPAITMGFPDGSDSKELAWNAGNLGLIHGSGRAPGEEMATHFSILTWRITWTEEPGRLQSMGFQGVRHDWATKNILAFSNTQH